MSCLCLLDFSAAFYVIDQNILINSLASHLDSVFVALSSIGSIPIYLLTPSVLNLTILFRH